MNKNCKWHALFWLCFTTKVCCCSCVQRQERRGSTCKASFTNACPSCVGTPATPVSEESLLFLYKKENRHCFLQKYKKDAKLYDFAVQACAPDRWTQRSRVTASCSRPCTRIDVFLELLVAKFQIITSMMSSSNLTVAV